MILTATARCLHPEPGYRIAQPLLLTHGAHDGTGNIRRSAPVWAPREPHARYTVVPAAGHVAHMDNPSFFDRLLLDFLHEQLPSRDG
jgi:3-oxoadipate enol-lactonase